MAARARLALSAREISCTCMVKFFEVGHLTSGLGVPGLGYRHVL
jgi:hypothetical protein